MNEETYTNIPRFWFSRAPGPDGQASGQFPKTLTTGQIEHKGFRMIKAGLSYEVWEKQDPPVTYEELGRELAQFLRFEVTNGFASFKSVRELGKKYLAQQGLL